jgi:hypothetical protein
MLLASCSFSLSFLFTLFTVCFHTNLPLCENENFINVLHKTTFRILFILFVKRAHANWTRALHCTLLVYLMFFDYIRYKALNCRMTVCDQLEGHSKKVYFKSLLKTTVSTRRTGFFRANNWTQYFTVMILITTQSTKKTCLISILYSVALAAGLFVVSLRLTLMVSEL